MWRDIRSSSYWESSWEGKLDFQITTGWKMTITFLSSCLYPTCSIYRRRPFTPCSPFQAQPDFISNAAIPWGCPRSLKSNKLSCKPPCPPPSICVSSPATLQEALLSTRAHWSAFLLLANKRTLIQITLMDVVLNLLSVRVLETQGRMETGQTEVQCGSHGLIIDAGSEPIRFLRREQQKTANISQRM